jgi:TolB protein
MSIARFGACLTSLLLASVTHAADGFPLKKLGALTWVVDYEPFWAPDGKRIVFISSRHGGMKVHVLAAEGNNGSDAQQLTTGPDEDDSPAWSPDGRQIAFVRIIDGVSRIFVMGADGSSPKQIAGGESIHPVWSPDGKRILFNTTLFTGARKEHTEEQRVIGERIDDLMELGTVLPDGSELKRLTSGGGYTYASYSPDGKEIVHRRQMGEVSRIFIMRADGTGDHDVSGASSTDGWPAWASDGRRIVFSRRVDGRFQLFVMGRDGGGARQLTDAQGEFTNPRWSPDGKTILCSRRLGDINLIRFAAPG